MTFCILTDEEQWICRPGTDRDVINIEIERNKKTLPVKENIRLSRINLKEETKARCYTRVKVR